MKLGSKFVKQQKRALEARLLYYERMFPMRPAGYRRFKLMYSIPRIYAALHRLKEGTYSICVSCDEKIDRKRHMLVPGALHCIGCQKLFEEEAKKRARL